ncbi:type I 3-dehydroquinate dehydratase [Candidatus Peregrinibacteria bacterium]|nr:type I 3-dehydroquinate dehydratase [Candidatus Peregrinibacteria bacterium]
MICASIQSDMEKVHRVPLCYDLVEVWDERMVGMIDKPTILKVVDEKKLSKNMQVDYIDFDIAMKMDKRAADTRLIISYHEHEYTPPLQELRSVIQTMQMQNADICKVVTMAHTEQDNITLLRLLTETQFPLIAFCMGEKGRLSRIMAPHFGSLISYVPPTEEWKTADGQIVLSEWEKISKTLQI